MQEQDPGSLDRCGFEPMRAEGATSLCTRAPVCVRVCVCGGRYVHSVSDRTPVVKTGDEETAACNLTIKNMQILIE